MTNETALIEDADTAPWSPSQAGRYDALVSNARVMIVDDAETTVDVLKAFLIDSGNLERVDVSWC